jgi:5-formyltetrahydrofolate cyclo-ligase
MSCKAELRKRFLEKRERIPSARREEAKSSALQSLLETLVGVSHVLSFASKAVEIDLWPLNKKLAEEGRLLLPRLEFNGISPYSVSDCETLVRHSKWGILEPDPTLCSKFPLKEIDIDLVPGIVFDSKHHRLGYGKGYYDRFLTQLSCPFLGVGFKEQHVSKSLDVEAHDIALSELFLF